MQKNSGKTLFTDNTQHQIPVSKYSRTENTHATFRPTGYGRHSGDASLFCFPDHISMTSMKEAEQKQFSIRSIKTTKNPSRSPLRLNISSEVSHDDGYQRSPANDKELSQYATIERILKSQNDNLKMQNELLLKQVYKLKQSNRKYKEEYKKVCLDIEGLKQECEAQKNRADEMKQIIMSRLAQLEGKINGDEEQCGMSECQSILQALTLSESGIK